MNRSSSRNTNLTPPPGVVSFVAPVNGLSDRQSDAARQSGSNNAAPSVAARLNGPNNAGSSVAAPVNRSNIADSNNPDEENEADDSFDLAPSDLYGSVKYRKATVEMDQMVLLLSTVKVGCKDARRTQVWNNLFSYICCVICASITTRDKRMSVDDISLAA